MELREDYENATKELTDKSDNDSSRGKLGVKRTRPSDNDSNTETEEKDSFDGNKPDLDKEEEKPALRKLRGRPPGKAPIVRQFPTK